MTSLLRTKRPTTVLAASLPVRTLVSVFALGLLLSSASAQEAPRPLPPLPPTPWQPPAPQLVSGRATKPLPVANPVRTLIFHKPAAQDTPANPELMSVQKKDGGYDVDSVRLQLEPPPFERLIRLESEDAMRERMRQEFKDSQATERLSFPEDKGLGEDRYAARSFPRQSLHAEPYVVTHKVLFFEEKNAERYGWDLGAVQPFLSASYFFADWVTLPYEWGSRPCQCCDSSGAGECLPGDPVPYLLRPPGLSTTGALAQAGAIIGLVAVFP